MNKPAHNHYHTDSHISEKNLLVAVVLNVIITITEVFGGFFANSLALFSDAIHNLGDGIAVLIAYVAHRISKRKSNERKTFGYRRIEILAAFMNAVFLVTVCIFLIVESVKRFQDPSPIKGVIMFSVAGIGLIANLVAVILLRPDAGKNMNVKAAYLHLLGDVLSSIVVIAGGILIYFFSIWWLDPLITILISLYIVRETFGLLKESVNILMQSTPISLNLDAVKKDIESFPEIINIHHIHAWNLNEKEIHFEGHIDLAEDLSVSQADSIRDKIESILAQKYNIAHVTLQMEFGCCDDKDLIHH